MTETQLRQKVVNQIKSWVGYNNADGSHKKIIDIYNSHKPLARGYKLRYTDAWCAGTVSAVAIACGLTDIMPTEVGVGEMIKLYQRLGRWEENDAHVPRLGDVIVYAWSDNGVGDCTVGDSHVGIVTDCDGKTITATEGNMVVNGVHLVGYRTIPVNGRYIRGFGLPDYASKATEAEPTTPAPTPTPTRAAYTLTPRLLKRGDRGADVRAMMLLLKDAGYYPYTIPASDDLFGAKMEAGVRKMQAEHGFGVDGLIGAKSGGFLMGLTKG
nr:MAG TPA: N acetylmuramidase [Bacteriophage sp.]